jgi:SAM-dependent methyltransferase
MKRKLHLGCGKHILEGYVNVDAAPISGVDLVHDLKKFPWPFQDGQFEEVIAVDVLEHLPDTIRTMEELYRTTKPGGLVHIRVPYFNSWDASCDPTHVRFFNENSFDFFDPKTEVYHNRSYYSLARFQIISVAYLIYPFGRTLLLVGDLKAEPKIVLPPPYCHPIIQSRLLKKIYGHVAHKLGNMIRGLQITLERLA